MQNEIKENRVCSIEEGARSAVETCMGLKEGERVLIVSDRAQLVVGEALRTSAEKVTGKSNVLLFILEDLAPRPLSALPKEIENEISRSNVTFWAATSLPGELPARRRFIDEAKSHARHGHMPNITRQLMEQGMCADYDLVYELTHRVYDAVKYAKSIRVRNEFGADLQVEFDPNWRWIPSDGRYHEKGRWGNLPEGEVFTAPRKVNGKLVTNLLGDWFSERYGNFNETLSFTVKDSKIELSTIRSENRFLKEDLERYLKTDEYSTTASEFALPTNPLLISKPTIGNLLQDEKARVHIAFGDPYQDETRAPWQSETHIDMLLERCDISADGRAIMEKGQFVI